MPEPLKNIYNPTFFEQLTAIIQQTLPAFKKQLFLNQVFDTEWESKELKQRMRHIATALRHQLPGNYKDQIERIQEIIGRLQKSGIKGGFEYMFLPDYIEQFGLDDLDTSLKAMESMTPFTSCEFAIRPFLLNYPDAVMKQMLRWSSHPHPHVRRFASEGCRPRLPWAMAIPQLKKDPAPILPILENLKADDSLFVRKSVANNLNDIAKDHPEIVVQIAKKWQGISKETDWIVRHGCRTLLKKAHPSVYPLFDLTKETTCQVSNFELRKSRIQIGEKLGFSFDLKPEITSPVKLRLEYAVYYTKANGRQNKKIFKLAESYYKPGNLYSFRKEQRFEDFTTRKHYPGKHKIGILVNGQELAAKEFELLP